LLAVRAAGCYSENELKATNQFADPGKTAIFSVNPSTAEKLFYAALKQHLKKRRRIENYIYK